MSPVSRFAIFAAVLAAFAPRVFPKGISVRFLPNPPEDSVVAYRVLRADGPGLPPAQVGVVPAAGGADTLAFADTSALRGRLYLYSIIGVDAAGGASDPSESTEVALPALGLPDTLKGGSLGARWTLALGADPLSGSAPLTLSLADSSLFTMRYDSAARQIVFAPRGTALSGQVVVRATYYGKFADQGTLWIALDAPATSVAPNPSASPAWDLPATWSLGGGALRLRGPGSAAAGGPAGTWCLLNARGGIVATRALPGNGSETTWDGRDDRGRPVDPAAYLWAMRGPRGALLRSGSLRILP
jgi:hypothetical protein